MAPLTLSKAQALIVAIVHNVNVTSSTKLAVTGVTSLAREYIHDSTTSRAVNAVSAFTMDQEQAIEITERLMSSISILASLFVIVTFLVFGSLRDKPINRIILLASFGNMMSDVATLISISGLKAGVKSNMCQVQGFLIQWFMPADTLWQLCLALNVLISFSRRFSDPNKKMRQLEPYYVVVAYGVPFILATVYLIMGMHYHNYVYGNATIWCWITEDWKVLRIATFYGPAWSILAITFSTYGFVGFNYIRKNRISTGQAYGSMASSEPIRDVGVITRTREFTVSHGSDVDVSSPGDGHHLVTHKASFTALQSPAIGAPSLPQPPGQSPTTPPRVEQRQSGVSAASPVISTPIPKSGTETTISGQAAGVTRMNLAQMTAARMYFWTALVLLIVNLIVWVPSTINRVYVFFYPPSFGLNLAAAFVLPLQGLMNCIVYVYTSRAQLRSICKRFQWSDYKRVFAFKRVEIEVDGGDLPLRERKVENRLRELEEGQEPEVRDHEDVGEV